MTPSDLRLCCHWVGVGVAARSLGIGRRSLARYISGERIPPPEIIPKILALTKIKTKQMAEIARKNRTK